MNIKKDKIELIKNDEIDFSSFLRLLKLEKKKIVSISLVFAFIGVIYSLLQTPLYKSTISIYPSGSREFQQLADFKNMVSVLGISNSNTKEIIDIKDILNSRSLHKKLLYYKWMTNKSDSLVDLIDYWDLNDNQGFSYNPIQWFISFLEYLSSNESLENDHIFHKEVLAVNILKERLSISKSKTGLYRISVLMEEKKMSADIANKIYEIIVDLLTDAYVQKAALNREFIEDRLKEVNIALENAEEKLKSFRQQNRGVADSPQLTLELERLKREVVIQSQLFITLQEQYELSKIKELDETPSLTILDEAIQPLHKDKPKRKIIVIVFTFLGLLISIFTISLNRIVRSQ